MKLAIVGGSAPSTPHLFRCPEMQGAATDIDVALIGRSSRRLRAVARAVRMVGAQTEIEPSLASFEADSLRRALEGAAIVLVQIRYGGYAGRIFDETFPLRYGLCGDEGLGPGGLSAAWRSWPSLTEMFDAVRGTCPRAKVLMLTSPVSLLVRCAHRAYPDLDVVGICELPWTTLRQVCERTGADPIRASFAYGGVNHLGWLSCIREGPRDIVREFRATRMPDDGFPSGELIASAGGVPLKYLRLHYEAAAVAREQKSARAPRGAELESLQSEALEIFERGDRIGIEAALANRPAPWYEHAVGPLIASMARAGSAPIPFFLTVRNGGLLEGFEDADVVEVPHRLEEGVLRPMSGACAVPRASASDLASFIRYERAAAPSVIHQSVEGMAAALAVHPWVPDRATAQLLARDIAASPAGVHPAAAAASSR